VFIIFNCSLHSKLEGLAAPSGVLTVGSIAIQLTDTIQKINQFVKIVAGARKEASRLAKARPEPSSSEVRGARCTI
jgi:hypothetical protein